MSFICLTGYIIIDALTKGAVQLVWNDFPDVHNVSGADSGDIIDVADEPGTPEQINVTMSLGDRVRDWKAAEIYSASGQLLGRAEVHRDSGVTSSTITVSAVDASFIRLLKAKLFGVHTVMYVIKDVASKAGRNITFTWQGD